MSVEGKLIEEKAVTGKIKSGNGAVKKKKAIERRKDERLNQWKRER